MHLTTPNQLHYEQVKATLAAGKHVVCEKPLGMDSTETAELLRLAEQSGLVHAVNFNVRFYAQCQEARARVARGDIGDVRLISGGYLQDWLLFDTDWNWRLDPAEGGSLRAVGDIGSHWLDLVQFITGRRVEAVMADLTTFLGVRKQPTGPVETFSGAAAGETHRHGRWRPRTPPGSCCASAAARAGSSRSARSSAGRKNRLSFEVDGVHERAVVDLRVARGAVARPPRPPQRAAPARPARAPAHVPAPAGHAEGFPDTFKALYRSGLRRRGGGRAAGEPTTRRSPTATTRP